MRPDLPKLPVVSKKEAPTNIPPEKTGFDTDGPDDADIADTWLALQSMEISPAELQKEVTRVAEKLVVTGDDYNLEKLVHFFPQATEVLAVGSIHEKGVELLRDRIMEGDAEGAVKIQDLLGLHAPLALSAEETKALTDRMLSMCLTADGDSAQLYKLGVSREAMQRAAIERINLLLEYGNNHLLAVNNPYIITNIICEVPEIEGDARTFIGKVLESSAQDNIRHGISGPVLHFVDFFEKGGHPLEPSPFGYISAEDIEKGIRYILGHHDVVDFKMFNMDVERDAKWDLYTMRGLLKHIPLSPKFRSSPDILKALKHEFIEGFADGSADAWHVREMLPHFDFSKQDVADIVKAAGEEWQWGDPQVMEGARKEMEEGRSDFQLQAEELLPRAREIIRERKDISWIVKTEICRYYGSSRLKKEVCEQLCDLFPESMNISATEVGALTLAWHEQSQRLIENPAEEKKLLT